MEQSGWVINTAVSHEGTGAVCGSPITKNSKSSNIWYGFTSGQGPSYISMTLKGSGEARLRYGNCQNISTSSTVKVYVNGYEISKADSGQTQEIAFEFNHGDILKIEEDTGIIKLHQLHWNCSSKKSI